MYDAIVIGSGPAGTACAITLSKNNKKVLLLEKYKLPRYKSCGGGLSQKSYEILKNLDVDINKFVENEINNVDFIYKHKNTVNINFDYPVIKTSMRDKLDFGLINKSTNFGTIVNSSEKVEEINQKENYIVVKTDKTEYKSSFVVGADGAHSVTAKHFNNTKKNAIAVEAEIINTPEMNVNKKTIELHYGIIPHGYGWIFPKKNVISIGIGSFLPKTKGLNDYYYKFKENIGFKNCEEKILKGHPIPILTHKNSNYNNGNILLVGDAAGLVDPLSGEGIYYALQSGIWAAEAIINKNSDKYTKIIKNKLLPQLKQAEILSKIIFNTLPVINKLINSNPDIAKKLVEVIYGKLTYNELFKYLTKRYSIFRQI